MIYKQFKVRLHEGANGDYYEVIVFKDKRSLKRFFKELGVEGEQEAGIYSFVMHRVDKKGKQTEIDYKGIIGFYKDMVKEYVVSHEMTHAINHYFRNQKVDFDFQKSRKEWLKLDELHAHMQSYLVAQFYDKYDK